VAERVLLLNPCYKFIYRNATIKEGAPYYPSLALASLAGKLTSGGHEVKILDLNLFRNPDKALTDAIREFRPGFAGITFSTPLFYESDRIVKLIKKTAVDIIVIGGGSHCSALPRETLAESSYDIICFGEGEETLSEIVSGKNYGSIDGICYRGDDGALIMNGERDLLGDLDELPFPKWDLFEIEKYKVTELLSRFSPTVGIETSRGCVFNCIYCNKSVFKRRFRKKSAQRVVNEMEYCLNMGFKEIHVLDDSFTIDMQRVEKIADEIINRGLKISWYSVSGIRVDLVNETLLRKLKRAGYYRAFFGIESGNQKILDRIKKGITIEQIKTAVQLARKAGMEVYGAFMLALPDETEDSLKDTIKLALELDLDIAKTTITYPLVGTPLYRDYISRGLIKSKDYSKYNFYTSPRELYDHPTLDWDVIEKYYKLFYRKFYFRPGYLFKRLCSAIRKGSLLSDIGKALRTKW